MASEFTKTKKGTQFAILVSREYLGDKLTGQGNVEALRISSGGKIIMQYKLQMVVIIISKEKL